MKARRTPWRSFLLAAATAGAWAMPVAAQTRPAYLPTRDVAVTYHIDSSMKNAPSEAQARYSAGGQMLRVESAQGVMLLDLKAEKTTMLMPQQQLIIDLPRGAGPVHAFMVDDSAKFTRTGSATVAGLRCTIWNIATPRGNGVACLTDDGVMLRGESHNAQGQGGVVEAVAVAYGAQAATEFVPPPGYRRMEIPQNLRGLLQGAQPH